MLKQISEFELINHGIEHADTPSCFQFPDRGSFDDVVTCIGISPAEAAGGCYRHIEHAGFDVENLLEEMYHRDLRWRKGALAACRDFNDFLAEMAAYPEESLAYGELYYHVSIRWNTRQT